MSSIDPGVYRRRRLTALGALIVLIVAIWGIPQLFSGQGQEVIPVETTEATAEPTAAEITGCAPGVVSVEAMTGRLISDDGAGNQELESLNSFAAGTDVYIWYAITNNGLVDCTFDVGTRATYFLISSGEQIYWDSRQCDRSGDSTAEIVLKSAETLESIAGLWEKTYSSENGCSLDGNSPVPTGGATFKIKVSVNGVISDDKRFILN